METSVVILKPDVFVREDRGEYNILIKELGTPEKFLAYVQQSLKDAGLEIVKEKKEVLSAETIIAHYDEHKGHEQKFKFLQEYMASGPSYVMLLQGYNAAEKARFIILSIREEFLLTPKDARKNMTHASGNRDDAIREQEIHFGE